MRASVAPRVAVRALLFFFKILLLLLELSNAVIYVMEYLFFIIIILDHCCVFWAKTAQNRLLIFHVAQIKFLLCLLAGSC